MFSHNLTFVHIINSNNSVHKINDFSYWSIKQLPYEHPCQIHNIRHSEINDRTCKTGFVKREKAIHSWGKEIRTFIIVVSGVVSTRLPTNTE